MTTHNSKTVAAYGTWKSPITSDLLSQKNISFGEIAVLSSSSSSPTNSYADIAYVENRPAEKGRSALIHRRIRLDLSDSSQDDKEHDLTLGQYNARSGVHEYGGGAVTGLPDGSAGLLFNDFPSSIVFETSAGSSTEPKRVTPENQSLRYGDFSPHPSLPLFLSILEDHTIDEPSKVVNTLVCVQISTSTHQQSSVHELKAGYDFYTNARFSSDGKYVAWVCWNHPSMPFWATELWVARFVAGDDTDGAPKLKGARLVGGKRGGEVVHHPIWAQHSNTLYFSSDKTGFAQPYAVDVAEGKPSGDVALSKVRPLLNKPTKSDFMGPSWQLNNSSMALLSKDWLICNIIDKAIESLALLHIPSGELRVLDTPFIAINQLRALSPSVAIFSGQTYDEPSAIVAIDVGPTLQEQKQPNWKTIKRSSELVKDGTVARSYLSKAEAVEFPTELPDGTPATAHAILFPPCNPEYLAPTGTSPPCIILSHGGPTSSFNVGLSLQLQYWTTRGYLVCCVNYGGSTGYGREYVERLNKNWGVVDVKDCVAAAQFLGSCDHGPAHTLAKARRRITKVGQVQMDNLMEKRLPSGAVEITLKNPGTWKVGTVDAVLAATLGAAGALIPGLEPHHGLAAAGLAWLYRKMVHVQEETVSVIPTVGIQLTTVRGFSLPTFTSARRNRNLVQHRTGDLPLTNREGLSSNTNGFFKTVKQTKLIPRDCILDLITNEAFRRWGVVDYCAIATRPPPGSHDFSRGDQLEVLFPNLLPRLPVVEHVYRTFYPAIFGHDVPVKTSHQASDTSSVGPLNEKAALAHHLPRVDPSKVAISGGSAGGYSVLCGLCLYPNAFGAGCSRYGIADLFGLEAMSHKFESRYLHNLLGGSPDQIPNVYAQRSPLNRADRIRAPVLFLQGDQDKVVPPAQSESMYKKIKSNPAGGKAKYVLFEGEGHGFRDAEHIKQSLHEEEEWYKEIFKFGHDHQHHLH